MKKLPIGIQSFEKLREDNYLYIDKTRDAFVPLKWLIKDHIFFFPDPADLANPCFLIH